MMIVPDTEKNKKIIMLDKGKLSTAYHEAGHAVMSIVLKIKFSFVTIRRRGYSDGRVQMGGCAPILKKHRNRIRREIIMLYAGDVSELIYYHLNLGLQLLSEGEEKVIIMKDDSDDSDDNQILMFREGIELTDAEVSNLYAEAQRLVIEKWDSIQIVASKLIKSKRLGYFQVRRLMGY